MPAPRKSDGSYDAKSINSRLKKLEDRLSAMKAGRLEQRKATASKRSAQNAEAKAKRDSGHVASRTKDEMKARRANQRAVRQEKVASKRAGMAGNKVAKGAVKARRRKAAR